MNEKRLNERESSGLEPTLNTSQVQLIFDLTAGFVYPFRHLGRQDLDIFQRNSKKSVCL